MEFGDYLEKRFKNSIGNVTLQLENTYQYKNVHMSELVEQGLPTKRMTNTLSVPKFSIKKTLSALGMEIKVSLNIVLQQAGSNLVFDRCIDMTYRCSEDALLSSGVNK